MSPRAARPGESDAPLSDGDGGPYEAACFVASSVAELAQVARRHGLETLGFLLDMALLEAEDLIRLRQQKSKNGK